jgi:transcriptional regulator with PAS, ATPase and Fis domain
MREVSQQIRLLGPSPVTVLVKGETGTGKGVVARLLHQASGRHPFVAVDVTTIAQELCESELFGHVKGAFTGADRERPGAFQRARGGTVFLDEIGELKPQLQAKLLTVLEEREIRPVGADERRPVDVRIIAATNRNLARGMENGWFRKDLYYRLKGHEIHLPPLREHPDDIPQLVAHFVGADSFSPEAIALLRRYSWPGNVRELLRTVESAILRAGSDAVLPEHLPEEVRSFDATAEGLRGIRAAARSIGSCLARSDGLDLRDAVCIVECEIISAVLNGNREAAARRLGISERTMTRKLKRSAQAEQLRRS